MKHKPNRGLTLLELVVVLAIMVALAGLIVPHIADLPDKSSSVTNATIVADTDRAVQLFDSRYGRQPSAWDSLLNNSGILYSRLNPSLTSSSPALIQASTLDAGQVQSLLKAGITGVHDADESLSGAPSNNSTHWRAIANDGKVVTLVKNPITTTHGDTVIDSAFGINQHSPMWANEFVVFGLGGAAEVKGTTMTEVPLALSANPLTYYARALCVYMIPATGANSIFPAQFVGTFLPDGSTLRHNVDKYHVTSN